MPTAAALRDALRDARLLVLNSPANPTGAVFEPQQLADICDVVLEENTRRSDEDRPLYVLYDQVYWMLTFGGARHVHPVALRSEMAPYTVYVDGISKAFAATGLRVGWAIGPTDVIGRMADHLTHVGAWAPRAEQVATATLLDNDGAIEEFHEHMLQEVQRRLDILHRGLQALRREGFAVDSAEPRGAIYLSAQFALHGKRTNDGEELDTNDAIRAYLLRSAGMAAVPFQAFGQNDETGWFRLSVGAVSIKEIEELLPRLRAALTGLR
jgi:aspartate aminotransferase